MKTGIVVSFMLIASLSAICSLAFAAMPNDLVLYMSFDKSTITGTNVKDLSNYGNNGVIKGAPKSAAGKMGDASLSFNGTTASPDSVEIVTSASLAKTATQITLEVWINPSKDGQFEIISKYDNDAAKSGFIHFETAAGGIMRFCIRNAANTAIADIKTAAGKFALNTWTHVAETYDGKTARIYFNGVEALNAAGTGNISDNANTKWWIGSLYSTERYFGGLIDEVRIWSRALTPDEVKKAMDGTIVGPAAVEKENKLTTTWGHLKSSN